MSIKKLALLLALPAALAHAQEPHISPNLPPAPATMAEAEANEQRAADMRRQADRLRAEAEAIRSRDDAACFRKILVNACRDKVRAETLKRMKVVRQLDIDANQIDRIAKARKVELDALDKTGPKPTGKPETDRPGASSGEAHSAPPDAVSPEAQKQFDAERRERAAKAEAARKSRNEDAAKRAEQARKDAERYDRQAREHAEKQAARKAAASGPR